jgi:hypothetical protein
MRLRFRGCSRTRRCGRANIRRAPPVRVRAAELAQAQAGQAYECFANLERNNGFGADSSPSRDDPCRRSAPKAAAPYGQLALSLEPQGTKTSHVFTATDDDVPGIVTLMNRAYRGAGAAGWSTQENYLSGVSAPRSEMISAFWSLRRTSNTIAFPGEKRQKRADGMSIAPVCRRRHTLPDCAPRAERWGLARLPRTVSASIQVHAGCGIEV